MSPLPSRRQFVDCVHDRLLHRLVALAGAGLLRWPIAHLDRIGAARDLDHRGIIEMTRKSRRIDGRRGDDQLQVGPPLQQLVQIAQQKVDIEAALVRLVDDQGVVFGQVAVVTDLGQQDPVGHQLDPGLVADTIAKTYLVANALPDLLTELAGDARGQTARGDTARLGMADAAEHPAAQAEADLRQLGRLARACLTAQHDHLMTTDQVTDLVQSFGNRQVRREFRPRRCLGTPQRDRGRVLDRLVEPEPGRRVGRGLLEADRPTAQTPPIAQQAAVDPVGQRGRALGGDTARHGTDHCRQPRPTRQAQHHRVSSPIPEPAPGRQLRRTGLRG